MRPLNTSITILLSLLFTVNLISQTVAFTSVFSGFSSPVDIANAGDDSDRLFIVERSGLIKIINSDGLTLSTPFLDIDSKVASTGGQSEQGLLGLAFHPNYLSNGYFYVHYSNNSGNSVIARYEVSGVNENTADINSESVLLTINQPFGNHNGGCLKFGPDGYLYIGMGDGGSAGDPDCYSQNNLEMLGKMLRLDVNQNVNTSPYYGIPASNPFVGNANYLPEIWSTGHRNPWRFSFDRTTGDMWIADVGQNAWEEVNFQPANSVGGEDYGWDVMEGNHCYGSGVDSDCPSGTAACFSANYTAPLWETSQSFGSGGYSITGGFVYRGCKYPDLVGKYVCADYVTDNVWLIDGTGLATFYGNIGNNLNISSFGEDESGELYVANLSGTIYIVEDTTNEQDCSCPADQYLTSTIASGVYQTGSTISSDGTVPTGSDVTFQSNEIDLLEDFEVVLNAEFLAEIAPCATFNISDMENQRNLSTENPVNLENSYIFDGNKNSKTLKVLVSNVQQNAYIEFSLEEKGQVELLVFDRNQKIIARLIEKEHRQIGQHSWVFDTNKIPSGIYTLQLNINDLKTITQKFIID